MDTQKSSSYPLISNKSSRDCLSGRSEVKDKKEGKKKKSTPSHQEVKRKKATQPIKRIMHKGNKSELQKVDEDGGRATEWQWEVYWARRLCGVGVGGEGVLPLGRQSW